jgi:hypothetical protein
MKNANKTSARLLLLMAMSCLGVLFSPSSSSAFLMHFRECGVGNFDRFFACTRTIDYPIFAPPGITDFRDQDNNPVTDWTGTWTSLFEVSAAGATRNDLTFALALDYPRSVYSFNFWVYEGSHLRDWTTISYNGQGVVDYNYDNWTFDVHYVEQPEPITLILFSSGLAVLVGFGLKRRF